MSAISSDIERKRIMSIEALAHNIFELHNLIEGEQFKDVDQKIQQIIKQYGLLQPGCPKIKEIYQKVICSEVSKNPTADEIKPKLRDLEQAIVKIVSDTFPKLELEKRFARHERIKLICKLDAVLQGTDLSPLKSILKQGPVDFRAIYITSEPGWMSLYHPSTPLSLLTYVIKNAPNDHLLTFLLKNGATINMKNSEEVASIMNYITSHAKPNFLDVALKAGFDLNCPVPTDYPNLHLSWISKIGGKLVGSIIFSITENHSRTESESLELAKLLIFNGAIIPEELKETMNGLKLFPALLEAQKLHAKVLNEMLNEQLKEIAALNPLSMDLINIIGSYPGEIELTLAQRIDLTNRCNTSQSHYTRDSFLKT
jgi:hypothetical protein